MFPDIEYGRICCQGVQLQLVKVRRYLGWPGFGQGSSHHARSGLGPVRYSFEIG